MYAFRVFLKDVFRGAVLQIHWQTGPEMEATVTKGGLTGWFRAGSWYD